jgi:outer membrane lipoprotein carrier protein
MKNIIYLFILILCVSGWSEENVEKIIKKVQDKYKKINALNVDFKQVNRFKLTGIENEVFGSLFITNDEKFRLETEDQLLVSDGEKFWRYNKLENQVIIDYAKKTQQDIFLNNFLFKINDNYYSQIVKEHKLSKGKVFEIKLTPRNPDDSFFDYIKVWLKDNSWDLLKVVYVDFNENEVEYIIEETKINPKIGDNMFQFSSPEGVETVDLRF